LGMFAAASVMVSFGASGGWTPGEFRAYWLLGAVLTVPYLAAGELALLVRSRGFTTAMLLVLLFGTAFALARVRSTHVGSLGGDLPSGSDAFAGDPFAVTLARLYSIPAYVVLVAGAAWSAWRMRGRPHLRDRFI